MDVEAILKEIRNRVVSEAHAHEASSEMEASANGSAPQSDQSESLTRASAQLAVTGRSWDRLPPILSNRQGLPARLELWIKTRGKRLTRWFTWEQVNFNRAVNDALCDVVEVLKAEAHELAVMRAQLTQEMRREFSTLRSAADEQARLLQDFGERAEQTDAALANLSDESRHRQNKLAEHYRQVQTELTNLKAEHSTLQTEQASLWAEHTSLRSEHTNLRAEHTSLRAEHTNLETEHANLANQVIELADQLRAEDREIKLQHDREIDRRLTELAAELKEEQRVCFRQVSLEASESAVLEDRARRALLQRLEKLEAALKASQRG